MMSGYQLHDVPNDDLITQLKRLVGSSNELTALLLAHLAEVDARGLYRNCACATLYAYCVYELRLSEDEAQRRCRAARVARQFPRLLDMLADGSIHLTGILLLAPHLTHENHDELLVRARYRTKREIERLVADVAPCPDAPSLIQPLGRAPEAPGRPASTWAELVRGWAGPVRQLVPGDGRAQAPMGELARQVGSGDAGEAPHAPIPSLEETAPARATIDSFPPDGGQPRSAAPERGTIDSTAPDGGRPRSDAPERGAIDSTAPNGGQPRSAAPERGTIDSTAPNGGQACSAAPERETIDSTAPNGGQPRGVQRYKVQFTVDQSYVELLERVRDLLQHEIFDRDLARVHQLALEGLLEKLSKRKYAGRAVEPPAAEPCLTEPCDTEPCATEPPAAEPCATEPCDTEPCATEPPAVEPCAAEPCLTESCATEPRATEPCAADVGPALEPASATRPAQPATTSAPAARVDTVTPGAGARVEPGRYIPANVKRAVWARDEARCTFTDARGQRCRETTLLEFHHREAYAKGGPTSLSNLTLHCRSHNRLAAEAELGRAFVDKRRHAAEGGRHATGQRDGMGEARWDG